MNDIIKEGHPTLTTVADDLEFPLSQETIDLAHEMLEYVVNSQDEELAEKYGLRPGVGLAAPQVNRSVQLCVIHVPQADKEPISKILVNPKIISHTAARVALRDGEGCLSVERPIEGLVPRNKRVTVRYQDLNGETHEERFRGYPAVVVQHEIDHLNGILFFERISQEDPFRINEDIELL